MNEERLLPCDNCACAPVCKYARDFRLVHEAIENLQVKLPMCNDPKTEMIVKISDIPWISKTQNLHCIHYTRKVGGTR